MLLFQQPGYFAGIEQFEIDNPTGRPYFYAYPELAKLPVISRAVLTTPLIQKAD